MTNNGGLWENKSHVLKHVKQGKHTKSIFVRLYNVSWLAEAWVVLLKVCHPRLPDDETQDQLIPTIWCLSELPDLALPRLESITHEMIY